MHTIRHEPNILLHHTATQPLLKTHVNTCSSRSSLDGTKGETEENQMSECVNNSVERDDE